MGNLTTTNNTTPSLNCVGKYRLLKFDTIIQIVFSTRTWAIHKHKAQDVDNFLIAQIISVCDFLNVSPKMNPDQIKETVRLILKEIDFTRFKPEDFIMCFDRAKAGHYGKVFNRIDGQVIMEWLWLYQKDRLTEIIEYNVKMKELRASGCMGSSQDGFKKNKKLDKMLAELTKKLSCMNKKQPSQPLIRERTEAEQFVDEIIKKFDSLYKLQRRRPQMSGIASIKFIEVDKMMMDFDTYLLYMYDQQRGVNK